MRSHRVGGIRPSLVPIFAAIAITAFACGGDASPPVASTGLQPDVMTATPSSTPNPVAGAVTAGANIDADA
ncbi:MAG TPA: hypothetical protein DCP37_02360 [Dehalococcoidia bacterium]|nr:hypothetical protein [SAR202 cluster bacterium]HAL46575.1 hypothetical protein [Dehalococcoidia bacterium]